MRISSSRFSKFQIFLSPSRSLLLKKRRIVTSNYRLSNWMKSGQIRLELVQNPDPEPLPSPNPTLICSDFIQFDNRSLYFFLHIKITIQQHNKVNSQSQSHTHGMPSILLWPQEQECNYYRSSSEWKRILISF